MAGVRATKTWPAFVSPLICHRVTAKTSKQVVIKEIIFFKTFTNGLGTLFKLFSKLDKNRIWGHPKNLLQKNLMNFSVSFLYTKVVVLLPFLLMYHPFHHLIKRRGDLTVRASFSQLVDLDSVSLSYHTEVLQACTCIYSFPPLPLMAKK